MGVYKLSANSVKNGRTIYGSMLAGNTAFVDTAFESIATISLSSSSPASVEFTNIPQTFTHLQVRMFLRYTTTSPNAYDPTRFRFNGDSGSNYTYHYLTGNGSSANVGAGSSQTNGWTSIYPYAGDTSTFGAGIMDILDYTNTNKYKTVKTLSGSDANGSGEFFIDSSVWMNTSAVTSIRFYDASISNSAFRQYSHFALYGIKAA